MLPDPVEGMVLLNKSSDASPVAAWLEQRGFQTKAMQTGLLFSGPVARVEEVFGVDLRRAEPPVDLPVPAPLTHQVSKIGIPRTRKFVS